MAKLSKNPLFRGLTRPAMLFGIPLVPFYIAAAGCFLVAVWTSMFVLVALIPILLILRLMTQVDEKIFQLVSIRRYLMPLRLKAAEYRRAFKANYYTSGFKKISEKAKNRKESYTMLNLQKAISLEEIIPYSSQISAHTIITRQGFLVSTWQIEGISYETRDNESLDMFRDHINNMIRALSNESVAVYVQTVRKFSELKASHTFQNKFAEELHSKYIESFHEHDFMENVLYLSLVWFPSNYKIGQVNNKLLRPHERLTNIDAQLNKFEILCERFEASLQKFGAARLETYQEDDAMYSSQLTFYHFLLTGYRQKIRVLNRPVYTYLGNVDLHFGKDLAQITHGAKTTFMRSIEIKDWVKDTSAGLLDELNNLHCRFVLTQSFSMLPRFKAKKLIERQENQMKSTDDDSVRELEALTQAKEDLASGDLCFGEHHLTLVLYADTLEEINRITNQAFTRMENLGFLVSLSNIALDEAYFSQLPANFKFRPRTSLISSLNFADLNSLHNNPIGKPRHNCWGEAVTLLKTQTNTPFYFNFHQTNLGRDDFGEKHLGHTVMIGKSGTGKTVLCNFLLSQMLQYEMPGSFSEKDEKQKFTAIYLDKDYGAEIGVQALGGKYNVLKNGRPTGFNPFLMDNTPNTISFLNAFMAVLATSDGSTLTTEDKMKIDFAVNAVMSFDREDRAHGISLFLQNLQEDFTNENSLKKRLSVWQDGNMYGWVFDNAEDTLSFDEATIYGFDGTEILDNKAVIEPVAFYLLHRIRHIADGRRLVIFLDEFWKWLQGDAFREFVYDGLKTLRKSNAFIVCATQSPDEIIRNPIARAVIEQTETFIFLPNSKAKEEEYKEFNVSEKEFAIIQKLADDSRQFLIKKGNASEGDSRGNTVVAKLDLSSLGRPNLKILSGSIDNVQILEEIIQELGTDDPQKWIPVFRQRCV